MVNTILTDAVEQEGYKQADIKKGLNRLARRLNKILEKVNDGNIERETGHRRGILVRIWDAICKPFGRIKKFLGF